MIRIADGQKLAIKQSAVNINGHAIEFRINAESPENGFMPRPGKVTDLHFPGGNGIRIDSALYTGYHVPSFYDAMIAKVIVHGKNRAEAIDKMRSALGEVVINGEGLETNVDFLYDLVCNKSFIKGDAEAVNDILEKMCK